MKMEPRLFYVKLMNSIFFLDNRKDTEDIMENLNRYYQRKHKMTDWYRFKTRYWWFEGASKFFNTRMHITNSLKVLEILSRGQTFLKQETKIDSSEPTIEKKLYLDKYFHR